MSKKAVCIISGGMDSCVAANLVKEEGYKIVAVHFNYGQRTEKKELESFRKITKELSTVQEYEIDLDFFKQIGASSLIDTNLEIRKSGVESDVPNTYVPFRNGIFLSIAGAIAEKENADAIVIGAVEEDSSGYPDCRNSFINSFFHTLNLGTKDDTNVKLLAPLIDLKKNEIVAKALEKNINLSNTWSCYEREDKACGKCDSCRLRLKGFAEANSQDPIPYMN